MSDQTDPTTPAPRLDGMFGGPPVAGDLTDAPLASLGNEARRSLCLLIDISWSIERDGRTEDLNHALGVWPDWLRADAEARRTLDVAIVVMGPNHEAVTLALGPDDAPFTSVRDLEIPELRPDGTTPLGLGLRTSLELCRERSAALIGSAWRRPRLAVITDGQPTDAEGAADLTSWRPAARRIVTAETQGKLSCLGVAVGAGAEPVLREFCQAEQVVALEDSFEKVLQLITMSTYYPEGEALARGLRSFEVRR